MGPIICAAVACAAVFVPFLVRVVAAVSCTPKQGAVQALPQPAGGSRSDAWVVTGEAVGPGWQKEKDGGGGAEGGAQPS